MNIAPSPPPEPSRKLSQSLQSLSQHLLCVMKVALRTQTGSSPYLGDLPAAAKASPGQTLRQLAFCLATLPARLGGNVEGW